MKHSWVALTLPILMSLAGIALGAPTSAQELTLLPRFAPDPTVNSGKIRGDLSLADLAPPNKPMDGKCGGYGIQKPTLTLTLPRQMPFLSLLVTTEANKTLNLLVRGPEGTFCRQGSRATLAGTWAAGKYEIWIGTARGNTQSYRLSLSEVNQ
ncbi:MAG: hypothetical protein HC919_06135 [Oscillatoriales cyanobacterium SM2_2_1]|nr:hypothetical protein [Oscillatoriales cyanobacterium SM2_2_1]